MSTKEIQQAIIKNYGDLPFTFVPNMGQMDSRVQYYCQDTGKGFYFTHEEAVFSFIENTSPGYFRKGDVTQTEQEQKKVRRGMALALHFFDANPDVRIEGQSEGSGKVHYLKGNHPSKWIQNLSIYEKIVYRDLWTGVDLVFQGKNGQLKYEFVVQPGANIQDIRLTYRGAEGLSLDDEGNLQIETPYGVLIDDRPISYQEINGQQIPVTSSFKLEQQEQGKNGYGFEVENGYDSCYPLIIDPGLTYSTYLGGGITNQGLDIAVDGAGHVYVTGETDSTDFPTTPGAFDISYNGGFSDTFVTKLNSDGSGLVYSTYLGGSGGDSGLAIGVVMGQGIAVDGAGHAYVTGFTDSPDYPTTPGAFDTSFNGGIDAFVTKLKRDGSGLVYSTYLGGSGVDQGFDIAVDGAGHAYVTGRTSSPDYPTTPGAFDTSFNGGFSDAFVTKLKRDGSGLVYSTHLGGSGFDQGLGIAVDGAGHAYVTGRTPSLDYPTTPGAFDTSFNGSDDAFVTKLTTDGSGLIYSTYLGGLSLPGEGGFGFDVGSDIAVDGAGHAYVTGLTGSPDFPTTPGAFDTSFNGIGDAFVSKLKRDGSGLVYSTYLGGSRSDSAQAIAVDGAGHAYVIGITNSPDFPTTPGAFDTTFNRGLFDAFVTKLTADGSGLVYSTYLGGGGDDRGFGIAVNGAGHAYVTGGTSSPNFPTTPGAFDTSFKGGLEAFVTKISTLIPTDSEPLPPPPVLAYVTNSGTGTVSVIDTAIDLEIDTITVGNQPIGVAITPNGTRVFVTNRVDNTVSVIDTATFTVIDIIPVGIRPLLVAITLDGTRAYVTNSGTPGNPDKSISVIDTVSNMVIATITDGVGIFPFGIAIGNTPVGTRAYVANTIDGTVSVIDVDANSPTFNTVIATILVGNAPIDVAITPNGTSVYITNADDDTVSVIDTATNIVTTVPVGDGPAGVGIGNTPEGTRAYVTNSEGNTITVIDTANNMVIATITDGVGDLPSDAALTPNGRKVYVPNNISSDVSVIDTATNQIIATILVGSIPNGVAIGRIGSTI